jgi:hypothetical protein
MWFSTWLACGGPAPVPSVPPVSPVSPTPPIAPAAPPVPAATPVAPVPPSDPLPAGLAAEVVQQGACPFECCSYNEHWVLSAAVPLHDAFDGKVISTLPAGTKLTGLTGTVKVVPGVARVTRPHPLPRGDGTSVSAEVGKKVYVLDNLGEGYSNVWYEGATYETEVWFNTGDGCKDAGDGCWAETITAPRQRWWARVRGPTGQEGWIDMDNAAAIAGVDGCG